MKASIQNYNNKLLKVSFYGILLMFVKKIPILYHFLRSCRRKISQLLEILEFITFSQIVNCLRNKKFQINLDAIFDEARKTPIVHDKLYRDYIEKGKFPKKPSTVNVELTNACNLKCTFCDRKGLTRRIGMMTDELFRKIIHEIADMDSAAQLNRFGESTLDKKLIERIKYAKSIGVKNVYMVSNLTIVSEKQIEDIVTSGLDRITISIDGVKRETIESIRLGTNRDQLFKNLYKLIEIRDNLNSRMTINIRVTLIEQNLDELIDIYRLLWGKVNNIIFTLAWNYENIETSPLLKGDWEKRIPCPSIINRSVICADGTQIMCCLGDVNAKLNLGNIKNQKIEEGFNGNKIKKYRENHRKTNFKDQLSVCETCTYTHQTYFLNQRFNEILEKKIKNVVLTEKFLNPLKSAPVVKLN